MKNLPTDVSRYATSPEFTEESIPGNLKKSHRTNSETWAKLLFWKARCDTDLFNLSRTPRPLNAQHIIDMADV